MMAMSIGLSSLKRTLPGLYFKRWLNTTGSLKNNKLSYHFSPGDQKFSHLTLGRVLNGAADSAGDDVAIVSLEQNIKRTFGEFRGDVDRLASGFLSLGLSKGDRVAICAPNVYEWPVTLFAAAKAGLILVNINPAYREQELEYSLNAVECKALVVSDSFKTQDYYQMLCTIMPELENSKVSTLQSKNVPSLRTVILLSEKAKNGTLTFDDVMQGGNSESAKRLSSIEESIQFDDLFNIQFTSGTTGSPKGAMLSHHNVINNALLVNRHLGSHIEKHVACIPIPLFHTFSCVIGIIGSVIYRNKCVLPSAGYDAIAVLEAIDKEKCTRVLGAPTMLVDLIDKYRKSEYSISSLKQVLLGGAPTPEQVFKDIQSNLNISSIHEGYGTTETSPGIAMNGGLDLDFSTILSAYLRPLDFVEVKIIDTKQQIVPVGEDGEICVRGHNVFMGYWNDKNKTDEAIDKTRWYHTGDIGKMNEKGSIKVVGRIKDLILRGGENVYPVEVENFLHKHDCVLEVHVCGVPDARMGEELCAWVKLKPGKDLSEKELKDFCKNKISHFKIPKYVMFVNDFPKTITGKVQKFRMKEVSTKQLGL